MKWLSRLFFALFGANLGALAVALLEAHTLSPDVDSSERAELSLSLYGVIAPVALAFGVVAFVAFVFFEPEGTRSPRDHLATLRALPVLARTRLSALLPLCVVGAFASLVAIAHCARRALAEGAPANAGAELALMSVAIFATCTVLALAASSPLRRLIAHAGGRFAVCIDPGVTTIMAIFACSAAFAAGIASGDTSGEGSTALAIFGVLKRRELDLDPVSHALIIFVLVYGALVVHAKMHRAARVSFVLAALCVSAPIATVHAARSLNAHGAISRSIEKHAAIARVGLVTLRRATDRDRDGFSGLFGGLDCDDKDPHRAPDQFDVPGNGIDEDCSGSDAPIPKPKVVAPPPPVEEPTRTYNVVLITIDTLRADVGFLGYPKDVTPNLDKLAAKSTVFEHAYAMASYTGKSIGPMLIGKYPSETIRDGSHFNKYEPQNVFVTERLHDAGVFTFGCAGHWYWKPWSGVTQGMDVFDLNAIPPGMGDNDDSVSGDRVSYVATRMLAKDEYTKGRFFMWIHYFDPHAQYVGHPGSPNFQTEPGGGPATRAAYDGEVWFTDRQAGKVIDAIAASPFAKDTAIIVTADHGEAFGEHNMAWHGGEIWEMLVHVPLLIYVPDAPPHRVKEKRSHIDLAPTILGLEGVKSVDDLDGQSLVPDVIHPENKPFDERDVYIDMPPGPWNYVRRALITGPTPGMKIVHLGGAQYQLFDLSEDPNEKNDLSSDKEKLQPFIDKLAEKRATLKEIDVKPDTP